MGDYYNPHLHLQEDKAELKLEAAEAASDGSDSDSEMMEVCFSLQTPLLTLR